MRVLFTPKEAREVVTVLFPLCVRRYAFTVVANITVYAMAYLLFHVQAGEDTDPDALGRADLVIFRVRSVQKSVWSH